MTRDSTRDSALQSANDSWLDSALMILDLTRDTTVLTRQQFCSAKVLQWKTVTDSTNLGPDYEPCVIWNLRWILILKSTHNVLHHVLFCSVFSLQHGLSAFSLISVFSSFRALISILVRIHGFSNGNEDLVAALRRPAADLWPHHWRWVWWLRVRVVVRWWRRRGLWSLPGCQPSVLVSWL